MILFRSANENDLDAIYRLAQKSGVGLTSLPKDKALLKERLELSCTTFEKKATGVGDEYYLFVLEESHGKIIGTSAIKALAGYNHIFYSFLITHHCRYSQSLSMQTDFELLVMVNDNQGKSEICTLFLDPAYRGNHYGQVLSKGRFLFMANFPWRFAAHTIAELRGFSDKNGRSPFWDHVTSHFIPLSFKEADMLTLVLSKKFIAELAPQHPIYVNLLPKAAQAAIGKVHPLTQPAMSILLKEGFHFNNYIDIFDGGPTLEAVTTSIQTISNSQRITVSDEHERINGPYGLISNTEEAFRATIGQIEIDAYGLTCKLDNKTARRLQVKTGESIRFSPLSLPPTHRGQ